MSRLSRDPLENYSWCFHDELTKPILFNYDIDTLLFTSPYAYQEFLSIKQNLFINPWKHYYVNRNSLQKLQKIAFIAYESDIRKGLGVFSGNDIGKGISLLSGLRNITMLKPVKGYHQGKSMEEDITEEGKWTAVAAYGETSRQTFDDMRRQVKVACHRFMAAFYQCGWYTEEHPAYKHLFEGIEWVLPEIKYQTLEELIRNGP